MCGTVGMFVGCAALSYCPRQLLAAPRPENAAGEEAPRAAGAPGEPAAYRSPFRNWYERASVRSAPRRELEPAGGGGAGGGRPEETEPLFFPPDLVPVSRHPLVEALPDGVFAEVLVQHLYRYLDFTAKLECLVVNRTVLGIAHGSVGVAVPDEMRLDAYKMYCDEAYHALFSADLAVQVRRATGITARLPQEPFFLRRLGEILDGLPAQDRPLAELLFVIISETLISASLADVPQRGGVVPAVTGTIRDHALDEGRHHAYFAHFLRLLWSQLSPAARESAGRLVPRLMDAFLRPDLDALRLELSGYGLSRQDTEQVVAEVYTPEVVAEHARATSSQTRRYFEELGAFDSTAAREELASYGFQP